MDDKECSLKTKARIVELDVGGTRLSTYASTILKFPDCLLARMLTSEFELTKTNGGAIFLDLDGERFRHILDFMRMKSSSSIPDHNVFLLHALRADAEYMALFELATVLDVMIECKEKASAYTNTVVDDRHKELVAELRRMRESADKGARTRKRPTKTRRRKCCSSDSSSTCTSSC